MCHNEKGKSFLVRVVNQLTSEEHTRFHPYADISPFCFISEEIIVTAPSLDLFTTYECLLLLQNPSSHEMRKIELFVGNKKCNF